MLKIHLNAQNQFYLLPTISHSIEWGSLAALCKGGAHPIRMRAQSKAWWHECKYAKVFEWAHANESPKGSTVDRTNWGEMPNVNQTYALCSKNAVFENDNVRNKNLNTKIENFEVQNHFRSQNLNVQNLQVQNRKPAQNQCSKRQQKQSPLNLLKKTPLNRKFRLRNRVPSLKNELHQKQNRSNAV